MARTRWSLGSVVGIGALVLLLAALALPRLRSGKASPEAAVPAFAEPSALPVEVVRLQPRRLAERLSTTGTIRANEEVDLVSETAGIVETILFEEGSPVEKGQILVQIDNVELQAQRDRVIYRLRLAEIREQRQNELRSQGVASEQDYDMAASELNVLRAELRLIEAQIEQTSIRAPFAGIVGLRFVSEGSFVTPQTRIARLQDLDPVKVDFRVPETYAGRIATGSQVDFRVKGSPEGRVATIYAIEPRVDPETRSLLIRARAPNPRGALFPGAFADVTLTVGEVRDALVVPSLAVIPELGGRKVFVVENGRAQPRSVETGIRTDKEVQITSGLEPGAVVIVSAIQRLRPDLPVATTELSAGSEAAAP